MRGTKRKRREGVWELRVYVGNDPVTGKPRQISKTFYGGAREAEDELRNLVDEHSSPRTDGLGVTFGQLLDKWLEECERLDLSPTTLRTYRSQIDKTLRPPLGKTQLTRLTSKHLDDLYGTLKACGRSPKTIRNYHAIISSALHQAVRWGWVRHNVAERAKPPRVGHRRVQAPTTEVVRRVIEVADERDPRIAPMLMLAALTGMRRGELCALRWSDVDLEAGVIKVSRSLVIAPGKLIEKSTKTDRSRHIALDPVGVALLKQHHVRVTNWCAEAGGELVGDAFVFSPFIDGKAPFWPDNITSFFTRVRNAVGAKSVRLHDLRHFTATQLIGAGVDVRTVAGRLGHSDPSLTLRVYSHVIEERDKAAAAIMGQLFSSEPKPELAPTS
ncbi:MAG: tyrosine-type recombinase/integrase [Nitrososphaerales archaeon]